MKFENRLLLMTIAPPILGALGNFCFLGALVYNRTSSISLVLDLLLLCLVFGFIAAVVPSFICALIMEWSFKRGLDPRSWKAAVLAGFVGAIAGMAMFYRGNSSLFRGQITPGCGFMLANGAIGLAVGLIVLLLARCSTPRVPPLLSD